MNTFDVVIPALGWALLHFLWQGALVAAVAGGVLASLRHARPHARYAVACVALVACMVLPLATMLVSLDGVDADPVVAAPLRAGVHGDVGHPLVAVAAPALVDVAGVRDALAPRLPAIVVAWSLGAALLALRMALGLAWIARVGGAGRPHVYWQAQLDALGARMKLSKRVLLRVVDGLDTPVVARVLRPVVLVPASLLRMPPDLLEALLAHELAHVRRHDYLVNLLQGAVEALLFYHPVVWWLSRRVRDERELIADDLAATALGDRRRVARALDALAALQARPVSPAPFPLIQNPALAADGGRLVSRIQHLVKPRRPAVQWKAAFPVIGISLLCLSFAQAQPAAAPAVPAPPAVVDKVLATPRVVEVQDEDEGFRTRGTLTINDDDDADRDSYALLDDDDADGLTYLDGSLNDLERLKAMRARIDGGFLWVRRDGREYVGSDPQLLAAVRAAWARTEPVSRKMEALGDEMGKHGAVMERLGARMEAASAQGEPASEAMAELGERMGALGERQAELGERIEDLSYDAAGADDDAERQRAAASLAVVEAEMEKISSQMEALGEQMEAHGAALERAQAPMEALGAEMERASEPMEALGEQMEVLGAQMEELSEQANVVTRSEIDAALRDGRLVPIERSAAR